MPMTHNLLLKGGYHLTDLNIFFFSDEKRNKQLSYIIPLCHTGDDARDWVLHIPSKDIQQVLSQKRDDETEEKTTNAGITCALQKSPLRNFWIFVDSLSLFFVFRSRDQYIFLQWNGNIKTDPIIWSLLGLIDWSESG